MIHLESTSIDLASSLLRRSLCIPASNLPLPLQPPHLLPRRIKQLPQPYPQKDNQHFSFLPRTLLALPLHLIQKPHHGPKSRDLRQTAEEGHDPFEVLGNGGVVKGSG